MEWISVDKEMPEEKAHYLVSFITSFGKHYEVVMLETHRRKRWMSNKHSFEDYEQEVTHWMPLTEPPN